VISSEYLPLLPGMSGVAARQAMIMKTF